MKKLTLCVLFCMLSGVYCFAGPFGIDMGMSLAEVRQACGTAPELIQDNVYEITPPKTNDMFETYYVRIDPEYGVYWLKAIGKDIYTNGHGLELIGTFENLVKSIEKTYGQYEKIDKNNGYFGDKPDYFMYALSQGDKTLAAIWDKEYRSELPDQIVNIFVMANASSSSLGSVWLEYRFSNNDAVDAKADTVF